MQVIVGVAPNEVWCKSGGGNGRGLGVIILVRWSTDTSSAILEETALASLKFPQANYLYDIVKGGVL